MVIEIVNNYDDYDGFVILYGIDIMVYIVLVLFFMFENFGKFVVFIGVQVSYVEIFKCYFVG